MGSGRKQGDERVRRLRRSGAAWTVCLCLSGAGLLAGTVEAGGGTLIVRNKAEAAVSVLDRDSGREVFKLPVGEGPHEVAVAPDGKTAVVANYGARTPGSTLTVLDLPTRSPVKTIDLGAFKRPHGIGFLPDGRRVAVTSEVKRALLLVDVRTGRIEKHFDTTQEISHMVALTPKADRAFVANIGSGSVSVLDLTTGKLPAVIQTGAGAEGIAVTPDGKEVWVANRGADTLSVIDAASLKIVETIPCKSFPIRIAFTPDGRFALVSNARSGEVAVFDTRSRKELRRIPMRAKAKGDKDERLFGNRFGDSPVPVGLLIPPDGRHAYVANTNADLITVIDLKTWKVVDRFRAGKEPDGMGYSPLDLTTP